MEGSADTAVHDPLYHCFPEKLSNLHLNPEYPQPTKRYKGRSRPISRYRTQPVTFDEIQEVDETPDDESKKEDFKNQLQAFSFSVDGLLSSKTDNNKPKKSEKDNDAQKKSSLLTTKPPSGSGTAMELRYSRSVKIREARRARRQHLLKEENVSQLTET